MVTRTVRVAVDQDAGSVLCQPIQGCAMVQVCIVQGAALARLTLLAQGPGHCLAVSQRLRQKSLLPGGAAHFGPKVLVVGVIQAQRITMRQ